MRIYVKNVPAKFHADLIGNDRALSFSYTASYAPQEKKNNKMSSDTRSVPDLKICPSCFFADWSVSRPKISIGAVLRVEVLSF